MIAYPWPQFSHAWALVQSNAITIAEPESRLNSFRMIALLYAATTL
jgi:hypothetical protein